MKVSFGQRLADFTSMLIMGALSLGLLAYVGFGEASRSYPRFEVDKVAAQGRPVQQAMEKYLNAGLPLRQFVGFENLTSTIVRVEPAIDAMTVLDRQGRVVFESGDRGIPVNAPVDIDATPQDVEVRTGPVFTQVILPLRSRFGFGGQLVMHVRNAYIEEQVSQATRWLPWAAALGSLTLALFGAAVAGVPVERRSRWDKIVFVSVFLGVTATVVGGLTGLYSTGAQTKAVGLANALAERVSVIYDMGLSLDDVEGIDRTFADYRRLNPDIRSMALVVDGRVIIHTDPLAIGKPLAPDRNAFEVLTAIDEVPGLDVKVYVSIPAEAVYLAVGRSVKTFVVLLVASGFMAALFFQLGGALRRMRLARDQSTADGQSAVDAIKPALFMGFLVESLSISFLPQLMQNSAVAGGLPSSLTSAMFMAYFITFAGALVPAGIFAAKRGPKPLIYAGAVLVTLGSALIATNDHYLIIVASRLISGLGQGMLFIGAQSFILAYAALDKRTQSAGIIVYTFNGGMLSGMTIGALLVGYIGPTGVFWMGAVIATCIGLYAWLLIAPPKFTQIEDTSVLRSPKAILGVFRSGGFLWTTMLVGIPAKAVLTGVIVFAMPLVLSGMRLDQEDIGQVIMFYALGVLISSHYVSRYADRVGNIREILFIGLMMSGLGLVVIGAIGWDRLDTDALGPVIVTVILLTGTLIVGLAHGCINAPVITHIASTDAARTLGEAPVTAFYRFIERVGHIAGPLVVGQLFFLSDQSPLVIAWLGLAMVAFGLLFILRRADQSAVH